MRLWFWKEARTGHSRPIFPWVVSTKIIEHGEPQEIILRLDHDEVGRNATKGILSGLKNANAKAVFCEKGKDYNEFLMMQKGLFSSDRSCGKETDR